MIFDFQFWPTVTAAGVALSWVVYLAVFLSRKQPPRMPAQRRAHASWMGMALQTVGYLIALIWWRAPFTPIAPMPEIAQAAVAIVTLVLSFTSFGIILAAVRVLGKHWSYGARLVEGHKLVIAGPYCRVRHPIYSGMLGMLIASGIAVSRWQALLAAVFVFAIGTAIRIRSEEKLLREAFGDDFDAYRRYVPAILPRLFIIL